MATCKKCNSQNPEDAKFCWNCGSDLSSATTGNMVKTISTEQIRKYLDDKGVSTRIDSDGDLFTVLSADNDFDHDVIIFFDVSNAWIQIYGMAHDFDVQDKDKGRILFALNELNKKWKQPKAYLNESRIIAQTSHLIDEEVSEAYIKENIIGMSTATIWQFFCELKKML